MKQCSACKQYKSVKEFHKRGDFKKLYKSQCKKCTSKNDYRKKIKGKVKKDFLILNAKRMREYRSKHPEYVKRMFGTGKYRYSQAKVQAKRSHCAWELTREEYYKLLKNKCVYCNKSLPKKGIALDKKNPSILIYKKSNVVPCCKRCNWIKSNWFTYNQMLKIGKFK